MSEPQSYFDLQVNGYGGVDFNQDELNAEELHRALKYLEKDGVVGVLATIITEHIDTKIQAFKLYENEIQPFPHPWSEQGLRLLAQYHGLQCGMPYAEAFTVIRGYEGLLPG